jgi:hypothetical protein
MTTKTKPLLIYTLILFIGLMMAFQYARAVAGCEGCAKYHRETMAGTADSPYHYRLLAPAFAELFISDENTQSILAGYTVAHMIVLPAMLVALFAWYRKHAETVTALVGVLLVAVYLPTMFQAWGTSLYTPLEVVFLCAGLLLLTRDTFSTLSYAVLVLIASLNRETAIVLPLAFMALHFDRWRARWYWSRGVLFGGVWAAVYVGLRLLFGAAPDQVTIAAAWANNTGGGWHTIEAVTKIGLMLPVWALVAVNARRAPVRLQRLALVGLPYLALVLLFGFWHETRLYLPLLVLWLPLGLSRLKFLT